MIEIKSTEGKTIIAGKGDPLDILTSFSNICAAVYDAELKCGLTEDVIKRLMHRAVDIGTEDEYSTGSVGFVVPITNGDD